MKARRGLRSTDTSGMLFDHGDRLDTLERRLSNARVEAVAPTPGGGGDGFASEFTATIDTYRYESTPHVRYIHPQGGVVTGIAVYRDGYGYVDLFIDNTFVVGFDGQMNAWEIVPMVPAIPVAADVTEVRFEATGSDSNPIFFVSVRFAPA